MTSGWRIGTERLFACRATIRDQRFLAPRSTTPALNRNRSSVVFDRKSTGLLEIRRWESFGMEVAQAGIRRWPARSLGALLFYERLQGFLDPWKWNNRTGNIVHSVLVLLWSLVLIGIPALKLAQRFRTAG
jgi:hypothetical protein